MSNFIKHLPCEECGSSDGNSLYDDGHTFCHVCQKHKNKDTNLTQALLKEDLDDSIFNSRNSNTDSGRPKTTGQSRLAPIPTSGFKECRGITTETMKKYQVWTQGNDQYYPYFSEGKQVANKIRTLAAKGFLAQGDFRGCGLFGQQAFPSGGKSLTITEGELDAMSVFQMFGSKYPAVSVKNAATATKDITDSWEYCNSFEEIIICFDKDEPHKRTDGSVWYPGQEASIKVAKLFPLGKARILELADAKDANDYLQKGWVEKFKSEWWKAPTWTPAGIKLAKDMWEEVAKEEKYETQYYPWEGLNDFTYGIRLSEAVLFTADTGVGKTQVLKEIEYKLRQDAPEAGIGLLHLEEPNKHTLKGLMSLYANKRLHLPDIAAEVTKEELRKYYDYVCDTDKLILWDHFGSNKIDEVLNTVHYMVNLGCKYIFIDHLSIIVSDQSGDERKELDEISTKLKKICMELNIAIICVIHINRKGEVRGSAGPEQVSNIVIKLERLKKDPDPWIRNVTRVVVEKNRFSGTTGPACYLFFNSETGRLEELNSEQIKRYEAGMSGEGVEDFSNWKPTEEVS